jgi:hypothetical protein
VTAGCPPPVVAEDAGGVKLYAARFTKANKPKYARCRRCKVEVYWVDAPRTGANGTKHFSHSRPAGTGRRKSTKRTPPVAPPANPKHSPIARSGSGLAAAQRMSLAFPPSASRKATPSAAIAPNAQASPGAPTTTGGANPGAKILHDASEVAREDALIEASPNPSGLRASTSIYLGAWLPWSWFCYGSAYYGDLRALAPIVLPTSRYIAIQVKVDPGMAIYKGKMANYLVCRNTDDPANQTRITVRIVASSLTALRHKPVSGGAVDMFAVGYVTIKEEQGKFGWLFYKVTVDIEDATQFM